MIQGYKMILDLVAAICALKDMNDIRRMVLETLRKMIWFDTANFWIYPPLQNWQEHIVIDTPAKSLNTYLEYYANLDEFHQTYNKSGIMIARSTDLLDYGDWTRHSEYYYDFLHSNNVYYLLAFDIKDEHMKYGAICFHREKCHGDFTNRERLLLCELYPHLVNRLRWAYEMQSLQMRWEAISRPIGGFSADWFELLTVREREIVQQVLSGSSNKEIAENLGISVNTVKMHVQNIFIKLGIKRRSQLLSR